MTKVDTCTVFIVDDDEDICQSIEGLLRAAGFFARSFSSPSQFMNGARIDGPSCLILDMSFPDTNGLLLQRELTTAGILIPIIFITGLSDVPMTVTAMKSGALEFLTKPFEDTDLLDAVRLALERDGHLRQRQNELAGLLHCYQSLTPREREVMARVVSGALNKQIAYDLAKSEITIKIHRGQVMRKMKADSLADLVRMATKLMLPLISSSS
jgi:FixJ family two-component response regulator